MGEIMRAPARVGGAGRYQTDAGDVTVACWTKLDNFAYFSSFVGNGIDTGEDECGFFLYNFGWVDDNEKDFGLAIRTEAGMNYVETPNIYEKDTWYHVAATYDGKNVNLYVNGVLVTGPTDVGGPMRWVSANSGNYRSGCDRGLARPGCAFVGGRRDRRRTVLRPGSRGGPDQRGHDRAGLLPLRLRSRAEAWRDARGNFADTPVEPR
jgi:hypothetical protein